MLPAIVDKVRAVASGTFRPETAADVRIEKWATQLAPQVERLDDIAARITKGQPLGLQNVRATAERVKAREIARYRATAAT